MLKNIAKLIARQPLDYHRVHAGRQDLQAAEFRVGEWTQFLYKGELRSGVVVRLGTDRVLLRDDAREQLRSFKFDQVEGRPQ